MSRGKFRVYNTKRGCYEDSRNHAIDCDGILYEFKHGLKPINMDIRIVEWCTGKKDIDNYLIYEGDTVERYDIHKCLATPGPYLVRWNNDGFEVVDEFEQDYITPFCKIVGNIHTNPGLLP